MIGAGKRRTREHRRGAAAVALVMAILLAGCSGSDEPALGAPSTPPPESTETAGEPAGPHGIPVLDTQEVAFLGDEWAGMNARNGISARNGRLYLGRSIDEATTEIVRVDPDTGEIVARRTLPKLQVWSVRDAGVLTQAPDRRSFEVLDLDTLEPLRQFTLPEDARAYVGSASTEPMWVGLRRFDEDQLQGIFTRMGAAQIDIDAGEVTRSVDLPPCGARNAVEPRPGTLVASNECTNQIMVVDLDTGELTTRPGFPTAAFLSGFGEQVWMRWNSYAVVARWVDGELITLDINGDGPHVTNLVGFIWADDHVLLNSDTEDASLPRLLHRIDPETVTVVGRAWIPPTSTFDGDVGYAVVDGMLVRMDPTEVTEAQPATVERPEPGLPDAVEAETPEEVAAIEAFRKVFDPSVPQEEVAPLLEDAEELASVRTDLASVAGMFPGLEMRITAIAVDGEAASLAYLFVADGDAPFAPLTGSLERVDGNWVVSRETVCRLAREAAIADC